MRFGQVPTKSNTFFSLSFVPGTYQMFWKSALIIWLIHRIDEIRCNFCKYFELNIITLYLIIKFPIWRLSKMRINIWWPAVYQAPRSISFINYITVGESIIVNYSSKSKVFGVKFDLWFLEMLFKLFVKIYLFGKWSNDSNFSALFRRLKERIWNSWWQNLMHKNIMSEPGWWM